MNFIIGDFIRCWCCSFSIWQNTKTQTVVKLTVVPCPPVVEVKIRRPDTKYQLGFSVQNGVVSFKNWIAIYVFDHVFIKRGHLWKKLCATRLWYHVAPEYMRWSHHSWRTVTQMWPLLIQIQFYCCFHFLFIFYLFIFYRFAVYLEEALLKEAGSASAIAS